MIPKMVDVLVHVDETLDPADQSGLDDRVRQLEGVFSVHTPAPKPHLMAVEYNPDRVSSQQTLASVKQSGLLAKLVGMWQIVAITVPCCYTPCLSQSV